jgi:hypothetical protein
MVGVPVIRFLGAVTLAVSAALVALPVPAAADGPLDEVAVALSGVDSGGCGAASDPCRSVGHAVGRVAHGGTVRVGPGWYAENVTIPAGLAVTVAGAGMDATVLNGRQLGTVVDSWDGATLGLVDRSIVNGIGDGVFHGGGVTSTGPLTVRRVRLWHNAGGAGGGIAAYGVTRVSESVIAGNTSRSSGGGIFSLHSILTVEKSAISDNDADAMGGGVYALFAAARIEDSTIAGNSAGGPGSGIIVVQGGLWLRHSTVAGNRGPDAAVVTTGEPAHPHDITGSLFADNTGGDCAPAYPPAIEPDDHNVSADGSCGRPVPDTDIDLQPLANGDFGTTPTRALGAASTIRGGIPAGDPLCEGTDQRGQTRRGVLYGGCDPGAYQSAPVPFHSTPPVLSGLDDPIVIFLSVGTATAGTWLFQRNLVYAFGWERCRYDEPVCVPIPGATARTYRVTDADAGHRLRVRVTATSAAGISQPAYSAISSAVSYG